MKTLLIGMPSGITNNLSVVYTLPYLGVFRLQHYLHDNNIPCDVFDPDIDVFNDFILEHDYFYDIVCIAGTHFSMDACLFYVNLFLERQKSHQPLLIAGGSAATFSYSMWLEAGFDIVVLGYGEKPLTSICQYYDGERTQNFFKKLENVKGVAYYNDDNLMVNAAEELTNELFHELTYERVLKLVMPYKKYWLLNGRSIESFQSEKFFFKLKTINLFTASQCPNNCGYCNSKFLEHAQQKKAKIYALTAEEICALLIENYALYEMEHVLFTDEDFLFSKKRSVEICNKIIEIKNEGKLPQDVVFGCQTRVVNFLKKGEVDSEFIALIKKAGFENICIGAESSLPHILATPIMNKNHYTKDQIYSIAVQLKEAGITSGVNFMLLTPESKKQDIYDELQFILQLIHDGIEIRTTIGIMAFPGAPAVSNPRYEISRTSLRSPISGRTLSLTDSFLPMTGEGSVLFSNFSDTYTLELERIRLLYNVEGAMRNSYYGLIRCIALAKACGFLDLYKEFDAIVADWLKYSIMATKNI